MLLNRSEFESSDSTNNYCCCCKNPICSFPDWLYAPRFFKNSIVQLLASEGNWR